MTSRSYERLLSEAFSHFWLKLWPFTAKFVKVQDRTIIYIHWIYLCNSCGL